MQKLFLLFVLISQQVLAQNGIDFERGTWNQILSKARAEKKIVFLDAYTTWCGPCKWMSSNTFTNTAVGTFFNKNYVNAKIDMEKGEGIELAKRYEVSAYPTLLFIDGNGKLLHKEIGAQDADKFLITGRNALNPDKQFYILKEKYGKNSITNSQMAELAKTAYTLQDPSTDTYISTYLKQQNNWFNRETVLLLLETTTPENSDRFNFLMENERTISTYVGADTVKSYLNEMAKSLAKVVADAETKIESGVKKFAEIYGQYRLNQQESKSESFLYGITRAEEAGNTSLYYLYVTEFVNLNMGTMKGDQLNSLAWNFYENVSDKSLLKHALQWALKSVAIESGFHNNDTVAHLYYSLGDANNAKKFAELAVRLGKAAGEDVKKTEELLKKLK